MIELLQFDWRPTQLRLLLAAAADAGPVLERAWAVRSGVPRNHVKDVIRQVVRLGGARAEVRAEGVALHVQPVNFWQVTPLADAAEWAAAWRAGGRQERLALVTEATDLGAALAEVGANGRLRIPVGVSPDSGKSAPDSGGADDLCTTFRRSDVLDPRRITSKRPAAAPDSGEVGGAGPGAGLAERIRLFVGERDWRRYWEGDDVQAIFEDGTRARVLESSLRYCQAALKEGVAVRKNTGAMLWEDYRRTLRDKLAKA